MRGIVLVSSLYYFGRIIVDSVCIIFRNHFGIQNKDEFLYYVFYVLEQYKLSSDQFEIVFLGKITAFKTYYQSIKEFHQIIRFEDRKVCNKIDIDQHPAPFFAKSPD